MAFIPEKEERLKIYYNTYNSKNEQDIKDAYKLWSPFYEYHIVDMGWDAPNLSVKLLIKYLDLNNHLKILDVGAGTGLVGAELNKFLNKDSIIDGVDLSIEMLELAKSKKIYNNLIIMNAEDMTFNDNSYDSIICTGSLNFGHIDPLKGFHEFIRIVKKNGIICFTIREDFYNVSKNIQDELETNNYWELLEKKIYNSEAVMDCSHYHFLYKCL